ncbi:hypothetical protein BZG36_02347 [Bifiguratus adelaidae]|uniref:Splicing factor Cactin n=1 Tax=Bifiguratus adelaidae TaxID=1938954 RepID=A0A261Y2J0_9FUNG|nr:hypothetical protein BZG36_02347 [Bifiguratus adelaidae]
MPTRSPTPERRRQDDDRHRHRSRPRDRHDDRYEDRYKDDRSHRRRRSRDRSEERSSRKHKDKKSKHRHRTPEPDEDEEEEQMPSFGPSISQLGYSNVNNPFNDVNLEAKFAWGKKQEKEKKTGLSAKEIARRERERRIETQEELEKLNKRRAEREIERELREEEMARMQREAEAAQMGDWYAREEEFHLEQAKRRAEIRIKEGRAKPIDVLAMNLRLANEPDKVEEDVDIEVDLEEPYTIFDNLTLEEMEELHKDINMYLALEKSPESVEFWKASNMKVVSDDKLASTRTDAARIAVGGVAQPINEEIVRVLAGKTHDQLCILEKQIHAKLNSGGPVDVEYWEHLLSQLVVYKSKALLRDMHEHMLKTRLEQLRSKQREEAAKVQQELGHALGLAHMEVPGNGVGAEDGMDTDEGVDDAEGQPDREETLIEPYQREMSPELVTSIPRDDAHIRVVEEGEDARSLLEERRRIQGQDYTLLRSRTPAFSARANVQPATVQDESVATNALLEQEIAKGLDEDENMFNVEAALPQDTYLWQDKYRPRKPRFFNRVHTGYEWNKYNQTHYDVDNPPPKVVQGYKFHIFYPDLIDPSKAPTYVIEKEPDMDETVLIRFKAGPPYEDIAFRIVNREWEYSHKKGFKSSFDRGVLQLFFHFKRHFYRK